MSIEYSYSEDDGSYVLKNGTNKAATLTFKILKANCETELESGRNMYIYIKKSQNSEENKFSYTEGNVSHFLFEFPLSSLIVLVNHNLTLGKFRRFILGSPTAEELAVITKRGKDALIQKEFDSAKTSNGDTTVKKEEDNEYCVPKK